MVRLATYGIASIENTISEVIYKDESNNISRPNLFCKDEISQINKFGFSLINSSTHN